MAILVKDGKILTLNGKTIKAPTGSGSSDIKLFAPTVTATDKTLIISDTKNGSFVETYDSYKGKNIVSEMKGSLDVSSYLNSTDEKQTFYVKARGLLTDSDKTEDVNYYKVKFINQDNSVIYTQIELENEVFEYDGPVPVYEGNFYGWNTNKDAQLRVPTLAVNKPVNYYAIYTHDFADTVVKVCDFDGFTNSKIYADVIDGNAYILHNNLVYKYDVEDDQILPVQIGSFRTRFVCASGIKLYTFWSKTLSIFNVDTCQEEASITLSLPETLHYNNELLIVKDNFAYVAGEILKNTITEGYQLIKYNLTTHTYTILGEFSVVLGESISEMRMLGDDIYMFNGSVIRRYDSILNTISTVGIAGRQVPFADSFAQLNGKIYTYDNHNDTSIGSLVEYAIGDGTTKATIMQGKLSIDGSRYLAPVTIGRAIYFFGDGKIQKYY